MALKDVNIKLLEQQEMTVENTGELLSVNKSTNSLFAAFFKQLAVEAGDRKEQMDELAKALGKGSDAKSDEKKVDKVIEKAKKGIFPSLVLGNFLEQIGITALLGSLPAIGLFLKQIGKATPTYILGNLVFTTMVKTVKLLQKPLNLYLNSLKAIGKFFRLDAFFKGAKSMGGFYGGLLKGIVSKISPFGLKDIKGFGTFLKNVVLKPFEVVSDAVKVGLGTGRVVTGAGAASAIAGGAKVMGPAQAKITQALGTLIENIALRFMLVKDAVAKFFKPLTSLFGGGGGTQSKGMMKITKAVGGFLKAFGSFAGKILKFIPIIGWIFVAFDAIKGFFTGFAKYKDEGFLMGAIGAQFGMIEQVLVGAIGIPFDMITKAVSWLLSKIPGGKFLSDKIDSFLEGGGFTGLIRGFFGGLMDMIGNFFASFFSGFENGIVSGLATMMLKMAKFVKKLYSFPIALVAGGVAALAHILGDPKAAFMKTFKKVMNAGDSKIDSAIVNVGGKTKEQAVADRMKKKEEDLAKKQLEAKKKENDAREKALREGATATTSTIVSDSSSNNSGNTTINNSNSSGGGGGQNIFDTTYDQFDRNSGWGFA